VFILRDEIPNPGNIFIDDLPIKGPATIYPDKGNLRHYQKIQESGILFKNMH
jgi:hypothetical protein